MAKVSTPFNQKKFVVILLKPVKKLSKNRNG